MMPVSVLPTHLPAPELKPCGDCDGRFVTVDDGSMTGVLGALIPCMCAEVVFSPLSACLCRVRDWPLNGGYTGWVEVPYSEFKDQPDGTVMMRPCPEHAHCRTTAPAAEPLSAPLSRHEAGVEYTSMPCQSCGDQSGARWVQSQGLGVLVHKGTDLPCPTSVPFDWETGEELVSLALTAVAA